MQDSVQRGRGWVPSTVPHLRRLLLLVLLCGLLSVGATRTVTLQVLADVFWQVACFVAFTMAIFEVLASRYGSRSNQTALRRHPVLEISVASFLGVLPGCGGAIVVTTRFVSGQVSFGAVVAALTSTMGDAAFLLLASEVQTGLLVIGLGLGAGVLCGLVVHAIHGEHFLRPSPRQVDMHRPHATPTSGSLQSQLWAVLLIPGAALATLAAFQLNLDHLLSLDEQTMVLLGAGATILCLLAWSLSDLRLGGTASGAGAAGSTVFGKVAEDTNFITSWVVIALLAFELTIQALGLNASELVAGVGFALPAVAVAVGLLPGCGPQIVITTLYLAGGIPLSAQIGNALSNDGDALFPMLALAPRAALIATLYSSIPALVLAYGYLALFE
ncbi:MAG: putative manganese transporter [Myxococcota bacterium]